MAATEALLEAVRDISPIIRKYAEIAMAFGHRPPNAGAT